MSLNECPVCKSKQIFLTDSHKDEIKDELVNSFKCLKCGTIWISHSFLHKVA